VAFSSGIAAFCARTKAAKTEKIMIGMANRRVRFIAITVSLSELECEDVPGA
jgi:hypothetical protein